MIVKGRYNKAKIFTDIVEKDAVGQIRSLCNDAAFKGVKIRVMPDVHAGAGCTIGTTMTIRDKVVPNMVGVDIGCGMELAELKEKEIDFKKLDEVIHERIPAGMSRRNFKHEYAERIDLSKLKCFRHVNSGLAYLSIGTLGGGNHFIEVDRDDEGKCYLVVHSGSRHLGVEVAGYYQREAYKNLCGSSNAQIREMIERLKAEGKAERISEEITARKAKQPAINPETAYVSGELFYDYLHDMEIVQKFATINRNSMVDEIVQSMGFTVTDRFTTVHNYVDTKAMILRKGAVSAKKRERLLIPINMRDGSLICVGKGKRDWNYSAPHGAGRALSRTKAFATLTVEEFEREMKGIYSTSVCRSTLDESPMAYKKLEDIVSRIAPTVKIVKRILPVYNFKAKEETVWRKRKKIRLV